MLRLIAIRPTAACMPFCVRRLIAAPTDLNHVSHRRGRVCRPKKREAKRLPYGVVRSCPAEVSFFVPRPIHVPRCRGRVSRPEKGCCRRLIAAPTGFEPRFLPYGTGFPPHGRTTFLTVGDGFPAPKKWEAKRLPYYSVTAKTLRMWYDGSTRMVPRTKGSLV